MNADAAHHFFILAVLTLATIFAIAAMRVFASARSGRRAASLPSAGAATLEALRGDVAEMKSRLVAVETLLREVG